MGIIAETTKVKSGKYTRMPELYLNSDYSRTYYEVVPSFYGLVATTLILPKLKLTPLKDVDQR